MKLEGNNVDNNSNLLGRGRGSVADPAKNLTTAEMGERSTTPFSDHTLF